MKLVTYVRLNDGKKTEKIGVLTKNEKQIVDLQKASKVIYGKPSEYFTDMIAFLKGTAAARTAAAELLKKAPADCIADIGAVRLLAPVPRPLSIRDTMCFEGHWIGCQRTAMRLFKNIDPDTVDQAVFKPGPIWYDEPRYYQCDTANVIGPDVEVIYPEGEKFKDYECELALYICKEGTNIHARDAWDYVGGYTIFNDFSSRAVQVSFMSGEGMNLGPGLGKDFANAMGPCLVTPDSFDPTNAEMIVRVNGVERGRGNHSNAYHKIPDIISYVSRNITLHPGEVIATGTVDRGAGAENGTFLFFGDMIELEIENIGVLRNTVGTNKPQKDRNKKGLYKRSICAIKDGKSEFFTDYPDIWRCLPTTADVWRVDEMPAADSATFKKDMGNLPIEHEAPEGGSVYRHVQSSDLDIKLDILPPQMRELYLKVIKDNHLLIGTKEIPTPEDLKKHLTMHRTDSLNLFFCSEADEKYAALNDEEDIHLKAGDALIQIAGMHGWTGKGVISGLLVSADISTLKQLTEKPKPVMQSKLKKFKRYVAATMKSDEKAKGASDIVIDDYSPNESEILDSNGKVIGYAGDIWKTFSAKADVSCSTDTVTGPMKDAPPKGGITFRMVELLPDAALKTNKSMLNYYGVIKGALEGISESGNVTVGALQDIIQMKDAEMSIKNTGTEPVMFAHFMIDAR
ncbi:MAG: fumarylacetoacetate hydrolase family protein [Dehalococcoidia bacterium]|jgi:2-keto-4-pentenoate hydratase/2-oxohepta-3-ene-1,7-dioic acid hydratase in catechol pathway